MQWCIDTDIASNTAKLWNLVTDTKGCVLQVQLLKNLLWSFFRVDQIRQENKPSTAPVTAICLNKRKKNFKIFPKTKYGRPPLSWNPSAISNPPLFRNPHATSKPASYLESPAILKPAGYLESPGISKPVGYLESPRYLETRRLSQIPLSLETLRLSRIPRYFKTRGLSRILRYLETRGWSRTETSSP